MELILGAGAEEVSDGVIIGVEEEGSEAVVVPRRALEVLIVA